MSLSKEANLGMRDRYVDLYYWLSHVGKGNEQRLFDAYAQIWNETNSEVVRSESRICLSQLRRVGHVVLPTVSNRSWVIHAPSLVMRADGNGAYWRGGIDQHLRQQIAHNAKNSEVYVHRDTHSLPPFLGINGVESQIQLIADRVGVPLLRVVFLTETTKLRKISEAIEIDAELPKTHSEYLIRQKTRFPSEIYKFHPPKSRLRFFVVKNDKTIEVKSRSEALFLAAENEYQLCHFSNELNQFVSYERLPLRFEVPLCLCTGNIPTYNEDKWTYSNVPNQLGNFILKLLGQNWFYPKISWF